MVFKVIADTLNRVAKPLSTLLLTIAAAVLAAMMFLTALDVALRYVFSRPLPGAFEVVEYMMAILVPFALVFTAHSKAHIGVDLVIEHLPKRAQAIINAMTTLLTFGLFVFMAWQSYHYIIEQYHSGMTSAVLLIPMYPFIATCTIAFAILCLVLFIDFLNYLSEGVSRWTRS